MEFPAGLAAALADGPVTVRAYRESDAPELFVALSDPAVWEHIPRPVPESPEALHRQLAGALATGSRITFTLRLDGRVVGTTSFVFDPADPDGIEIGATQLDPTVWGTGVNERVKRLLAARAFDAGAEWVQLRTDERNARSIAAIRKLGVEELGVRPDTLTRRDGSTRRSAFFRLHRTAG